MGQIKMPATNIGLAKKRVQWLIEHSTSHQILWYIDSLVLRNPLLRQAAKRCAKVSATLQLLHIGARITSADMLKRFRLRKNLQHIYGFVKFHFSFVTLLQRKAKLHKSALRYLQSYQNSHMKRILTMILILFCKIFFGQEYKIISLKDSIPEKKNYQIFEFINDKTSVENLRLLASISCEGDKSAFSNIFEITKFKSQNLGANSFKYIKKEVNEKTIKIFFDIYYSDEKYLFENRKNEEENKIYIFGSDNLSEKKKRYYKLDGQLKTLPIGGFDTINYSLGQTLKIAKKDFMSPPVIFTADKNFKSIFLNTDGWGRNESQESVKDYGIVKVITYELFYQFDKNLGFTLLEIKK